MATLTGSYQYIGRTNAVSCPAGWNYYILVYAKTSGSMATGKHTVSIKTRLACDVDSSFYAFYTTAYAKAAGVTAYSWSNKQIPYDYWGDSSSLTVGGVTYPRWTELEEGSAEVNTGYGVAKSIDIDVSWVMNSTSSKSWFPYTGVYAKASIEVTLPLIPGATSIDSLSCATSYFTGKLTYKYTPLSASMYNRCNISLNLSGEYIAVKSINLGKKAASQQTGTVTLSASELETIYENLPNSSKGTLRFTFRTYSDSGYSTQIGDAGYKEVTLYVPKTSDTLPSPGMTLSPASSLSSTFDGLYIQGKTKVDANFSGSGKYGASIKSYSMSVEGKSYSSPYTSGYLSQSGSIRVTGTATDSRGYPGTQDLYITVIPYSGPKVNAVCARCDADGNLSDTGTYLKITATRSYNKVISGGKQYNYCAIRLRYKLASEADSAYSSWVTLLAKTSSSDTYSGVFNSVTFDIKKSYTVQIGVVDDVGGTSYAAFGISTETVYMHKTAKGLGIGKYVEEENMVDVAWNVRVRGDLLVGPSGVTLEEYIRSIINEGG